MRENVAKLAFPSRNDLDSRVQHPVDDVTQTLRNRGSTASDRNDSAMKRSAKESMEVCQDVSKIINAPETPRSAGSHLGLIAIHSGERSIDPRAGCQANVPRSNESNAETSPDGRAEERGRGVKRKLDRMEDQAAAIDLDHATGQDRSRATERIEPRVKDATPMIFCPNPAFKDESATKTARGRIRRPTEGRSSSRRQVPSPKYASFLRMFRKEEVDERHRGNLSPRKDEGEKSQRRGLASERYAVLKRYSGRESGLAKETRERRSERSAVFPVRRIEKTVLFFFPFIIPFPLQRFDSKLD